MKRKILLTAMLMLVSLLFTACGEAEIRYSDKTEQLKLNMSYDEVKTIFGEEGELISDSELGDESHVMVYTWSNKRNKDDTLSCLFIISPAGTTSYLREKDTESGNLIKTSDTLNSLPQMQEGILNIKPDDFVKAFNILLADTGEFKSMGDSSNNMYLYEMGENTLSIEMNGSEINGIVLMGEPDNEEYQGIIGMLIYCLVDYNIDINAEIGGETGLWKGLEGGGGYTSYKDVVYGYIIKDKEGSFVIGFNLGNK